VRVQGPTLLYFEPIKLLNFDFNADSDPAFRSNAEPDPDPACEKKMLIPGDLQRICLHNASARMKLQYLMMRKCQ
jgi:hypothetical protein